MKCLSLDFGGSSVKYGLVSDQAEISENGKLPAPLGSRDMFTDTVSYLYEKYKDDVEGIAISIPGYIDPATGVLSGSGAYQELYGYSIPGLVHKRCNVNVSVENDGKCGALSEAWNGALKGCKDGVVLIMGSAIAGGVIKNGMIHSGKGFAAGEFSYFLTDPNGYGYNTMAMMNCCTVGVTYKLCKLKNLDFDVQDCSDLLKYFDSLYSGQHPGPKGAPSKIKATGKQFMRWVEEKDKDALNVYKEYIHALAMMVFNIQVIYAPEKIVIGGGLSRSDRIIEDLRKELSRYYQVSNIQSELRSVVERSVFMEDCNLLGAAYHYISTFNRNLI